MKKITFIFTLLISIYSYAGNKKQFALGLNVNTSSNFIGAIDFKIMDKNVPNFWLFELANVSHPSEIRIVSGATNLNPLGNGSFIYGKNNYLFALRAQIGRKVKLFSSAVKNGYNVDLNYSGGLTIGIQKPYFIKYEYSSEEIEIEQYDNNVHTTLNNILGSAGVFTHFEESKLIPALNTRIAFSFNNNNENGRFFSMLETGIFAEIYTRPIEIVDGGYNQQLFTSLFVTLFIGKS